MKLEISTFIELDRLIREGQHSAALQRLNLVLESPVIPREFLVSTAAISRRLSRSEIGINLLNPIVRPPVTKNILATTEEKAEYAACLIRLGLLKEAHSLLDTIKVQDFPRSLIFRAFAHIAQWDFEKSQECLESFIGMPYVDSYDVLIAQVNLAVGYVFLENFDRADRLLAELCRITLENNNYLLYANALELSAQSSILNGNFSSAEDFLRKGHSALASSDTIDAFFLKKDQVILELFQSNNGPEAIQKLKKIKQEAQQRKFWEQGRDCDYYLAIATGKIELAYYLYFGTPYEAYRKKLLAKLNLTLEDLPEAFSWQIGKGRKQAQLNIMTGENSCTSRFLNDGQVPQRLLQVLASDYYRPRRMMEMFEGAFPNEYFMPKYSTDKIHQGLRRLRKEVSHLQVPLAIGEKKGFYQLNAFENYKIDIICPRNQNEVSKAFLVRRQDFRLSELLSRFKKSKKQSPFTAKDFASFHKISERSSLRQLKQATAKSWVTRVGRGRLTKYKLNRFPF